MGNVRSVIGMGLLLMPATALAAAGRAGGILLQEPFGARPFALGQAYSALGDDVFGMFYNPAALSRLKDSQAATQFTQSIADAQLGYLGLASPLNPVQAIGIGAAYLDAGKIDIFDASGNKTSTANLERDLLVHLGYAHAFDVGPSSRLHLGLGAKTLRSVLVNAAQSDSYAADAGGILEFPSLGGSFSVGVAAANLGPSIKYSGGLASGSDSDPMPTTVRFGVSHARNLFSADSLVAGVEADRVFYDDKLFEGIGLEYNYRGLCSLRFGYRAGQDNGGLTMGLGLALRGLTVDYSIGLIQTFNSVQQVSLNYRFTIPGIRYSERTPPSPLETLVRDAEGFIASRRYFQAYDEIERIDAFFPGSPDSIRLRRLVQDGINAILVRGLGAPRYRYAVAFNRAMDGVWDQAVSNLQASLVSEPDNEEIRTTLAKAEKKLREQRRMLQLQNQARVSTLFELADKAYESGDLDRATRIADEILRLGPYAPAENLRSRIQAAQRRRREPPEGRGRPSKPAPQAPSAPPAAATVSPADAARAQQLYYEAVRAYADDDPRKALESLRQALRLDPGNGTIKITLDSIEKEFSQRQKTGP